MRREVVDVDIGKESMEEMNERSNTHGKDKKDEGSFKKKEQESEIEEREINEWKRVSTEKIGRSPSPQNLKYGQVTIPTPSRYAALSNMDPEENGEEGEEIDKEEVEEIEDMRNEEEDDIYQSLADESVEVNKKGRTPVLPRISKTNQRVIPEASEHIKDMRRGSKKNH